MGEIIRSTLYTKVKNTFPPILLPASTFLCYLALGFPYFNLNVKVRKVVGSMIGIKENPTVSSIYLIAMYHFFNCISFLKICCCC